MQFLPFCSFPSHFLPVFFPFPEKWWENVACCWNCSSSAMLGRFIFFHYWAQRLAGKNVSEMTCFCVEWDVKALLQLDVRSTSCCRSSRSRRRHWWRTWCTSRTTTTATRRTTTRSTPPTSRSRLTSYSHSPPYRSVTAWIIYSEWVTGGQHQSVPLPLGRVACFFSRSLLWWSYPQRKACPMSVLPSNWAYTGWAKKTALFFRLDNFVTVSPRKACSMSKFSKFYPEKGTKLVFQWILIIFAKFAEIITTAEIMLYMTRTRGFYSIYTNIQWNNCHFPTELVQTKLHVGTLCLDDHHQSF